MRQANSRRTGFTLVEILIVVIILGILAAIVIPQFSNAGSDARKSSLVSQLQTLRSQIQLYRIQHGDVLPDLLTDWTPLVSQTTYSGSTYGPYLHSTPTNALSTRSNVVAGDGSTSAGTVCGFIYDYGSGSGSGRIYGTDTDGKSVYPQ